MAIYRVVLNVLNGAQPTTHNVFHVAAGGSATDVGEAVDSALDAVADPSHLLWPVPSTSDLETVSIYEFDTDGEALEYTLDVPQTGGAGGNPIWSSASVVTLRTAARGPSARGRLFLGPCAEDANDSGILDPTGQALCQTAWDAFRTGMAAADAPIHVVSRATLIPVSRPVTTCLVRNYIATQRRRAKFLQAS